MRPQGYVLIAGQGRSGTNWILEILNLSRQTHCRNEPNECSGSAFSELPPGSFCYPALNATLECKWDDAVKQTSASFGIRDHPVAVSKDYFSPAAERLGLIRIARAKKLRKLAASAFPVHRREEWPIPSWALKNGESNSSLPIHKLNMVPGWIVWRFRTAPKLMSSTSFVTQEDILTRSASACGQSLIWQK